MSRWVRVRIDDDTGEGAGCAGCLLLAGAVVALFFVASFGSVLYRRYTDRQIESRRVPIPSEQLNAYAGQYDYNGRYLITVERHGDKLFSRSQEERCELMPISQSDFLFRDCINGFGGKAKFLRDARGQMSLQIFYRDGREESAPRK
jgi:hypothetical protein